jgi:hypothetical protein
MGNVCLSVVLVLFLLSNQMLQLDSFCYANTLCWVMGCSPLGVELDDGAALISLPLDNAEIWQTWSAVHPIAGTHSQ